MDQRSFTSVMEVKTEGINDTALLYNTILRTIEPDLPEWGFWVEETSESEENVFEIIVTGKKDGTILVIDTMNLLFVLKDISRDVFGEVIFNHPQEKTTHQLLSLQGKTEKTVWVRYVSEYGLFWSRLHKITYDPDKKMFKTKE